LFVVFAVVVVFVVVVVVIVIVVVVVDDDEKTRNKVQDNTSRQWLKKYFGLCSCSTDKPLFNLELWRWIL
jgi:hypothetical protein